MENKQGSGIFLGVIGVATLVVAIIGATFAYFSATATSGENAIYAQSTSLALGFQERDKVISDALIPAYDNIAKAGEELDGARRCVDDNMNDICTVYTFSIGNPSATTTQEVFGNLKVANTFQHLYFRVYEVKNVGTDEETETPLVNPTNFNQNPTVKYGETTVTVGKDAGATFTTADGVTTIDLSAFNIKLGPSATAVDATDEDVLKNVANYPAAKDTNTPNVRTFRIVVWLRELGVNQSDDTNKTFSAVVNFSTESGGVGVTGTLQGTSGANFTEEAAG